MGPDLFMGGLRGAPRARQHAQVSHDDAFMRPSARASVQSRIHAGAGGPVAVRTGEMAEKSLMRAMQRRRPSTAGVRGGLNGATLIKPAATIPWPQSTCPHGRSGRRVRPFCTMTHRRARDDDGLRNPRINRPVKAHSQGRMFANINVEYAFRVVDTAMPAHGRPAAPAAGSGVR